MALYILNKKLFKMKIIQCCGSKSWGGLEMQTLKIAKSLKERGHQVIILCAVNSFLLKEAESQGVISVPVFGFRNKLKALINVILFLRQNNPDIVHTHLSHDLWFIVPALYLSHSRAKLFLTKRMASGVKKTDFLHKFLYNRVHKIFAISSYIKTSVLNTCPVEEKDVVLLPNSLALDGYDCKLYDRIKIRESLHIKSDDYVIGFIGRMTPGKGHVEFLTAARIIKNVYPLPVKFLIVGEASYGEESYESKIKNLATNLFTHDEVYFTGFRKDIPALLIAMDVLAFPSYEESFGNVLLEAMAMQLPVVASSGGGVPDIVIHNENGLLVPPKDADKLASGLLQLILNSKLAAKFAANGRYRVETVFNAIHYIDTLEQYYQ